MLRKGIRLMELLAGYDKAIIIDAIQTPGGEVGEIYHFDISDLRATRHSASVHDLNLATALEQGERIGLSLPHEITIIAIEISQINTFSEECSPEVAQAIPGAANLAAQIIQGV